MSDELTRGQIRERVESIEGDSWECLHYRQLRKNASRHAMAEALRHDAQWLENHNIELQRSFDALVKDLED